MIGSSWHEPAGWAFELQGVSRTYDGSGPPVRALRPADLRIAHNSFTAIVGPSGSGKSTLLNILGMLDRPSTGRVIVDGAVTEHLRKRDYADYRAAKIGFVFQAFHLLGGRSVLENVELGLMYSGVRRQRRQRIAASVAERVGLGGRFHTDVRLLSGGERQRVAIARAVAAGARLLLCDEPTGNLDQDTSASVIALLSGLRRDGATIVVVTHDPAVAGQADTALQMSDGMIGSASEPVLDLDGGR